MSRAYLEFFAWIFLFSSLSEAIFPQIWNLELDVIPSGTTGFSIEEVAVGMIFIGIDLIALLAMRSKQVKGYTNVF